MNIFPYSDVMTKVPADFMNNSGDMSYSRVEVASGTRHSARCCGRPPLLRCNEVDGVRSARPKGKRCRHMMNIFPYSDVMTKVPADFMNNSG